MDKKEKEALWLFLSRMKFSVCRVININEILSDREKKAMKEELQNCFDALSILMLKSN